MLGFLRKKRRASLRRYQAQLELLEDRTVPATITLTGAGRFQDGPAASLINVGGNNYTAINLRSAIIGANMLAGPDIIYLESGTYTVDGSAGQMLVNDLSGNLTIANGARGVSTINAQGACRVFLNQGSLTLSGLKIENGLASDRGGAIFNNGVLNIVNCQFVNNEALGGLDGGPVEGGAIFNNANRTLNIQDSTFAGNSARGGTSSILFGGTADAAGGAIFFAGGIGTLTDTILDSTFANNQATGGAGAVVVGFGSRGGHGAGGGIFAQVGNYNLNVINSTFAANAAQGGAGALADGGNAAGGGLYLQNGGLGAITLADDTIALNSAVGGQGQGALAANGVGSGGGMAGDFFSIPVPKVINTIIGQNSATIHNDVDGVFRSLGSNLIGDATGAAASFNAATGDFVGTTAKPLSANIDPLGFYGGPTQTFRLRSGSFAIDRGNNSVATGPLQLTTDQRGQSRLSGSGVDIGSYEVPRKALSQTYSLVQGTTLTTTAANGLLAGFDNPLHRMVTVQLATGSGPAVGKLTLNANGTFSYKPPSNFRGTVSFQFVVFVDGEDVVTFTVTLNVTKIPGRLAG